MPPRDEFFMGLARLEGILPPGIHTRCIGRGAGEIMEGGGQQDGGSTEDRLLAQLQSAPFIQGGHTE